MQPPKLFGTIVILTVAAGSGLACDGSSPPVSAVSGGTDGGVTADAAAPAGDANAAPAKCELLINTICRREGTCLSGGADGGVSDCVHTGITELDCAHASSVSATFDECIIDLGALSCTSLYPGGQLQTPESCRAAIDWPATKEQMQCTALETLICKRFAECLMSGMPQQDQMTCEDDIATVIPCEFAVGVSGTYDACMQKLMAWTCAMVLPQGKLAFPTECSGSIITNRPAINMGTPERVPMMMSAYGSLMRMLRNSTREP